MDEEIIEHLISFIKLHSEAQGFGITWYGGEPLLAFEVIQKILNRIRAEINIPLKGHSIITNGYYFTDKVIQFFKEYPLNSIQITLDGNKERHNSLRKQKITGEGTYDRIITNIDNILDELPNTKVSIRVNIEKNNIQDFLDAHQYLTNRWKDKNIVIYPGILRIDNEDMTALACNALDRWETNELLFELSKNKIIDSAIYPELHWNKNCCATKTDSYIIGPRGEIYKCWNDVSDDQKIIGYINNDTLTNPSLLYRYLIGSKWYHNSDCKDCFFLPICHGTCAWYRLRNLYEKGKYDICDCLQKSPEMLNKCLEYYYNNQIPCIESSCSACC